MTAGPLVRRTTAAAVAVVEIDNPPVNVLSAGVIDAFPIVLEQAERDPHVSAIVVRAAGRTFVVGADITALQRAAAGDLSAACDMHGFLSRLEDCTKPVVIAVHGNALGGGLELAMAGHYRVAAADAKFGQPEINLGIIPGAEGTQRLPRLVGVPLALEMCITGTPIAAPAALDAGLIDAVADGDLTAAAVAFAESVAAQTPRKTRELSDKLKAPASMFADARQFAARVRPDEPAARAAVDAIEAAATMTFDDGCRRERELFFECVQSDQARERIAAFFAERAAAKVRPR
jgi:3-hydroxyacyl-CoA dehydrogenase